MVEVIRTSQFAEWFKALRDVRAKARIQTRITRLETLGDFGDVKRFDGIGELRIHEGPGYRVYFVQRGATVVILLCGGDKGSQKRDIAKAKELGERI